MARFFLEIKTHTRTRGDKTLFLAALQSPSSITDTEGVEYPYHPLHPVVRDFILAPPHAPDWIRDRFSLWSMVDQLEKRVDAQLCRSIHILLPPELSTEVQTDLLRTFVNDQFVALGMIADCAIYLTHASAYGSVLLCTRSVTPNGLGLKNRAWNNRKLAITWRKAWEETANRFLQEAGVTPDKFIDRRSKEDRAIDGSDTDEGNIPFHQDNIVEEDGF